MVSNQIIAVSFFLILVVLMPKSISREIQSVTFGSEDQWDGTSFKSPSLVVQDCAKRLQGQSLFKCVDEDRKFLCNKNPLTYSSLGRIKYCLSSRNHRITLHADLKTAYHLSTGYFTYDQLDARVERGLSEMVKLYNNYGIDLALNLTKIPIGSKGIDFIVQDSMNTESHMFRFAPMYRGRELAPQEFGLLFSHEVSHHFGLPDRYQSTSCPLREVSDESLMGHRHQSGINGMKLSEADLKLLLAPLCDTPPPQKTIRSLIFRGGTRGTP